MWDCCFFLWDPKICGIYKYLYKAEPGAARRPPPAGWPLQSHDSWRAILSTDTIHRTHFYVFLIGSPLFSHFNMYF
jgi:hypothetical protein